jgi:hypothetical protein
MNIILKILAALALIAIITASGVYVIKTVTSKGDEVTKQPRPPINPSQAETNGIAGKSAPIPENPRSIPKFKDPIVVTKDDPLQPKYLPINQPTYLQNVRTEGRIYINRVMGKLEGEASKKDWGMRGTAYFTYIYAVESTGKILKNDGVTIIEERLFGKVAEDVMVSKYNVGFELPAELSQLGSLIEMCFGGDGTIAKGTTKFLNTVKIPFYTEWFDELRKQGILPQKLDPELIKNDLMMFAKTKNGRILEGKKVRITFKDGTGITGITPLDGCQLSEQEVDVIKRSNFVMDHYIFPDQQVKPDSEWSVNGNVFAGLLDPRLEGKVEGTVTMRRTSDFADGNGEISKRLRLINGQISFVQPAGDGQVAVGQLNGVKGICLMPDKYGVITSATITGSMQYDNMSTDHLLFEAKMSVTPRFEISYECAVE